MKSIAVSPLCHNYTCCGLNLQGHHALVEHFEEFHIVVDPCSQLVSSQPYSYSAPSASTTLDLYIPHTTQVLEAIRHSQQQHRKSQSQLQLQQYQHPQQEHEQGVISRVIWNQGTGLKGVTELYLRAVRGEGDSPLFKGVPRKAGKGYTCSSPRVRPAQRAQRLSHTNLMQS